MRYLMVSIAINQVHNQYNKNLKRKKRYLHQIVPPIHIHEISEEYIIDNHIKNQEFTMLFVLVLGLLFSGSLFSMDAINEHCNPKNKRIFVGPMVTVPANKGMSLRERVLRDKLESTLRCKVCSNNTPKSTGFAKHLFDPKMFSVELP